MKIENLESKIWLTNWLQNFVRFPISDFRFSIFEFVFPEGQKSQFPEKLVFVPTVFPPKRTTHLEPPPPPQKRVLGGHFQIELFSWIFIQKCPEKVQNILHRWGHLLEKILRYEKLFRLRYRFSKKIIFVKMPQKRHNRLKNVEQIMVKKWPKKSIFSKVFKLYQGCHGCSWTSLPALFPLKNGLGTAFSPGRFGGF